MQVANFIAVLFTTAYAPLALLAGWLRHIAEVNPVTQVLEGVRQGFVGAVTWHETWPALARGRSGCRSCSARRRAQHAPLRRLACRSLNVAVLPFSGATSVHVTRVADPPGWSRRRTWITAGLPIIDCPKRIVMLLDFERVTRAGPTRTGVVPSRSWSTAASRRLPSFVAVAQAR